MGCPLTKDTKAEVVEMPPKLELASLEDAKEAIKLLRSMTVRLLNSSPTMPASVIYNGIGGDAQGISLFHDSTVSVQKASFPAGMEFPEHIHSPSSEWVIVVKGLMRGKTGDEIKDYPVGTCQFIPPETPHQHWAVTDVEVIGITVPAEEAYPNDDAIEQQ